MKHFEKLQYYFTTILLLGSLLCALAVSRTDREEILKFKRTAVQLSEYTVLFKNFRESLRESKEAEFKEALTKRVRSYYGELVEIGDEIDFWRTLKMNLFRTGQGEHSEHSIYDMYETIETRKYSYFFPDQLVSPSVECKVK